MNRPGYIENELSNELQKLIKIASADALDGVLAGIGLAIIARQNELDTMFDISATGRYQELVTEINTLQGMQSWVEKLKEGYEVK